MENSRSKIVKEITQELNCGNNCYYNSKTDEIIAIPNFSSFPNEDEFREYFKEDLKSVRENKADLVKIEVLGSFDSFKILEQFIYQIDDFVFKTKLENILQEKKPFQNFKNLIDKYQ